MKTILFALTFATASFGQSTTLYSWTFPALGAHDPTVTVNNTYDQAVSMTNFLFAQQAAGPSTITSDITKVATSVPLANITGLAVGNGLCFSPSPTTCSIVASVTGTGPYTYKLSTPGEVALITAITPGTAPSGTVTVVRQTIGTGAAYSSGQPVTFLQYGSFTQFCVSLILNAQAQIIANPAYGSQSATTAAAAIAAAQAALAAAAATH